MKTKLNLTKTETETETETKITMARDEGNEDIWHKGNEVLYKLCADYPDHRDDQIIVAKVWLIGRSYAAAVERGRTVEPDTQTSEDFYREKVTKAFREMDIDNSLRLLKESQPANDADDADWIRAGLEIHGQLVKALKVIAGSDKRSFASKYLHFHVPDAFFIYDSIASRGLSAILPHCRLKDELCKKGHADGVDDTYRTFVNKVYFLREEIRQQHSVRLTPRQIDRLLLLVGSQNT